MSPKELVGVERARQIQAYEERSTEAPRRSRRAGFPGEHVPTNVQATLWFPRLRFWLCRQITGHGIRRDGICPRCGEDLF